MLDKFLTRAIHTKDIDIRNKTEKFADFYTENLWGCKVEEYAEDNFMI